MASYPSAVKTFTTKNALDTIQPSHINDLQDEIAAIESGLLNGTAPMNSSRITAPAAQISNCTVSSLTVSVLSIANLQTTNSTTANLNVTGGSTLATLNVTGASTLSDVVVTAAPPAARVSNNANLNTNNGSTTRLTFNTQQFTSTSGMHSTTTNPGRLIAVSSGIYLISGCVTWSGGSTGGYRNVRILINGSSIVASDDRDAVSGGNQTTQNVFAIYRFASSGSYAELEVYQNSGSTLSVLASGDLSPMFSMARLR